MTRPQSPTSASDRSSPEAHRHAGTVAINTGHAADGRIISYHDRSAPSSHDDHHARGESHHDELRTPRHVTPRGPKE
jgi:hypothetical protein